MKCKIIIFVLIYIQVLNSYCQTDTLNLNVSRGNHVLVNPQLLEIETDYKKIGINGFVDAYYSYDFAEPFSNEKSSFFYNHNKHNELSVNLALIKLNYNDEKTRGSIGLMAGTYAQYNLSHEQDLMRHIFEAYAGVKLYEGLWLDAGVFGSHLGFESAISSENITLTRSLMAENSPYYLSGAKLTYTGIEKWTFLAVLSNGWQNISEPWFNENKAVGVQTVFTPNDNISFNYSGWFSDESSKSFPTPRIFNDIYMIFTPTNKLKVITAFDYGMQQQFFSKKWDNWYAPAVLLGYDWHTKISTGLRVEYYSDVNEVNISTGTANGFQTFGASLNLDYIPAENAFLRIEGKWLNSKDAIFLQPDFTNDVSNFAITTSLAVMFGK